MTLSDLVERVKTLPKPQAEFQIKRFIIDFIGPDKPGQLLENRYKRKIKRNVSKL